MIEVLTQAAQILALAASLACLIEATCNQGVVTMRPKLIPDYVSAAYIRRMVKLATEDAFKAGRAMTLRGV